MGWESISGFAAVADGEDDDLFAVEVVEGDVGSVAEFDYPLAEFGEHFLDRAADLGMFGEGFHALADGGDGAAGCVGTFGGEEIVEASEVTERSLGPPYL